jgi:uncharacterized membrane protein
MFRKADWTDARVGGMIANLLRAGVILAALVVLIGGLVFLFRNGTVRANYQVFSGEPTDLRHWRGIVQAAVAARGRGIIQLGLLLLIATPVARVAFGAFAFAIERDWLYVGITLFVLAVLMYSLLGSGV